MNRLLVPLFALTAAILLLAGCDPETQHNQQGHRPGGFAGGPHQSIPPDDGVTEPVTTEGPRETEKPPKHEESEAPREQPVHNNTPPPATGTYEYGKAVPGKPGFVTSPYAPYQGYVDVRGYAPGTEVKDPYTGKTFLVPAQ